MTAIGIGISPVFGSAAGAGGAGFSPDDLSWLVWLDASDTTTTFQDSAKTTPATSDADPVGAITDKSGNANELVQATTDLKPALKLNIQCGNSVLRMNSDYLIKALATGAIAQPFTVFFAAQMDASVIDNNTDAVLLSSDDSTNFILAYKRGDAGVADFWRMFGDGKVINGGVANANWNIWTCVYSGVSSEFYINGILQNSGDAGTDTPDGLVIGALFNGSSPWTGDFGELFIGQGVSDDNRQLMENWLAQKWICG